MHTYNVLRQEDRIDFLEFSFIDNDDLDDWSSFIRLVISSLALTLTTLAGFILMVKSAAASTDNGDVVGPEIITHFLIIS